VVVDAAERAGDCFADAGVVRRHGGGVCSCVSLSLVLGSVEVDGSPNL
jgi:hypothetical protein